MFIYMNYSFMMTKYYFICDLIFTLLTWVHLMGPILFPFTWWKATLIESYVCLHESRLWVIFCFPSLDEEQHRLNQLWVQFCFSSLDEEQRYVCLHESRLWVQFCLAYFRLVYSWRYALVCCFDFKPYQDYSQWGIDLTPGNCAILL